MNAALMNLAERIRQELREIDRIAQRAQTTWRQLRLTPDDAYLDSTALNLHGVYEGLERLFSLISLTVDKKRLHGSDWHQELLTQMQSDVPGIRPAVISAESGRALDKLRGFRHVVRHVYTFNYDPQQIGELMANVTPVFERVRSELLAFADFLEQAAQDER